MRKAKNDKRIESDKDDEKKERLGRKMIMGARK